MGISLIQYIQKNDILSRGGLELCIADIDLGSYVTNGIPFPKQVFGINNVIGVQCLGGADGYVLDYDHVNNKLKVFNVAGFTPAGSISVSMTDGERTVTYAPGGGDIKGATNQAGTEGNADQNATAVNGALLLAATTFTVLAGVMTPTAQPDVPRNLVIQIENDSGGALDLFEGTTTFAVTGFDARGTAQTENITLVSTAGNKSVANTKFRFIQGTKAWSSVTSVTITNAPAGGLKGSLGVGTRIGLPTVLDTAAAAEVVKVTVDGANVAVTDTDTSAGGVDQTNNCVNTGTIANGADVGIIYNEDYDGQAGTATLTGTAVAAAALAEVANATSLTSVDPRILVIGW